MSVVSNDDFQAFQQNGYHDDEDIDFNPQNGYYSQEEEEEDHVPLPPVQRKGKWVKPLTTNDMITSTQNYL